jgi:hypothetical protein
MTQTEKILLGLGATSSLGLAWWLNRLPAVESRLHVLNPQKFVNADPAGLARAAGTSLDVYALASAMQSEEKTRVGHVAVGCAVRNYCRKHRVGVVAQLLKAVDRHGRRCPSHGHFGSQEAVGKWAATSKPPTASTLTLAQQILAAPSPIADPTHGATRWYSPTAQDASHRRAPELYSLNAEQLKAKLISQGGKPIAIANTLFWSFA